MCQSRLLFLFLLTIYWCSCYVVIKLTQYNGIKNRYKSILHESSNDNDDTSIGDIKNSIKQEISDIINMYMQKCSENVPLSSVNPGVLIENSFLLSKVGFYEEIMEEYLNACTSLEEVVQLEKVDGYLRKFISSERKSRSRLKINYLMAGAVSNRFEEAVQTLSDCDEIDSELLLYTNNLMQREYKRALGPTAPIPSSFPDPTSPDNNNDDDDSSDEIDGELLGSTGAQVIQVLRMIYNRLLVESKMKQNNNIRVLAKAMNTNDAQTREMILRASFKKVEEINDFEEFLTDAIQHITNLEQQDNQFSDQNTDRGRDSSGISDGIKTFKDSLNEAVSTSNNNANNKNKNNNKSRGVKVGTLENLREVQYAFIRCKESLVTGLTDDNLFSTTAEDYKQWSSVPDESLSGEGTRSSTSTNSNRGGSIPTFDNSDTESDTVEDLNNLLYGPKTV